MISSISGSSNLAQSYMTQMRQQMFNKIDTDGDGKHSKDEISAMVANGPQGGPSVDEIFGKADTDEDGYISQSEFDANSPPPREMQGSGVAGMANVSSADFLEQMFNKIDTDGDGKHSKDEISAMVANGPQGGPSVDEIFDKADTDEDGYISQSEFDAVQADGAAQGNISAQSGNSLDSTVKTLLEALEEEKQSASSTASNILQTNDSVASVSQMLNDALKSYLQLSSNSFSQSGAAGSLLASTLYA